MRKIFIFLVVCGVLAFCVRTMPAESESRNEKITELTFVSPRVVTSVAGSYHQTEKLLDKLAKILERKHGIKFSLAQRIETGTSQDALDELIEVFKDKGDMTVAGVRGYYLMKKAGIKVKPLLTMEVNGKATRNGCFYVAQDSPYKKVSDLRGKAIRSVNADVYPQIRQILLDQGINQPLQKFFAKQVTIDNFISAFYALVLGDIDVLYENEYALKVAKAGDASIPKKVRALYCSDTGFLIEPFLVYKPGKKDGAIRELQQVAVNAHNDSDFKSFFKMFDSIAKFRFVVPDDNKIAAQKKTLDAWEKKGWIKEAAQFETMAGK